MQKCGACEIARYAVSAADSVLDFAAASSLHAVHGSASSLSGYVDADVRDFGLKPPRLLMIKVEPCVNVRLQLVAAAKN